MVFCKVLRRVVWVLEGIYGKVADFRFNMASLAFRTAPPARSAPPGAAAWKGAESHRHPKFGRRRGRSTSCHLELWVWGLGFTSKTLAQARVLRHKSLKPQP